MGLFDSFNIRDIQGTDYACSNCGYAFDQKEVHHDEDNNEICPNCDARV